MDGDPGLKEMILAFRSAAIFPPVSLILDLIFLGKFPRPGRKPVYEE